MLQKNKRGKTGTHSQTTDFLVVMEEVTKGFNAEQKYSDDKDKVRQ